GDFMHERPPSEKTPSPAARSGYTPLSVIFWGWAHGSPVPYHAVIVAYTEFTFRSPSGSATWAKTKNPMPDWTGSITVVEYRPSAHLSTNTGGRDPAGGVSRAVQRTTLFSVSTMVTVTWSVDRRVKFLYSHRSPTFHTRSVPSTSEIPDSSSRKTTFIEGPPGGRERIMFAAGPTIFKVFAVVTTE